MNKADHYDFSPIFEIIMKSLFLIWMQEILSYIKVVSNTVYITSCMWVCDTLCNTMLPTYLTGMFSITLYIGYYIIVSDMLDTF